MSRTVPLASRLRASRVRCADKSTCSPGLNLEKEFLSPRAREEQITPRCAKRRSPLRSNSRKRHAICSRRGGRLVQWTAGRRRSSRDSRLIVKTSPRITANWPALASSILEVSGPAFINRMCGATSPARSVPDPPASTAPRAREEIKTHADLCQTLLGQGIEAGLGDDAEIARQRQ